MIFLVFSKCVKITNECVKIAKEYVINYKRICQNCKRICYKLQLFWFKLCLRVRSSNDVNKAFIVGHIELRGAEAYIHQGIVRDDLPDPHQMSYWHNVLFRKL